MPGGEGDGEMGSRVRASHRWPESVQATSWSGGEHQFPVAPVQDPDSSLRLKSAWAGRRRSARRASATCLSGTVFVVRGALPMSFDRSVTGQRIPRLVELEER